MSSAITKENERNSKKVYLVSCFLFLPFMWRNLPTQIQHSTQLISFGRSWLLFINQLLFFSFFFFCSFWVLKFNFVLTTRSLFARNQFKVIKTTTVCPSTNASTCGTKNNWWEKISKCSMLQAEKKVIEICCRCVFFPNGKEMRFHVHEKREKSIILVVVGISTPFEYVNFKTLFWI